MLVSTPFMQLVARQTHATEVSTDLFTRLLELLPGFVISHRREWQEFHSKPHARLGREVERLVRSQHAVLDDRGDDLAHGRTPDCGCVYQPYCSAHIPADTTSGVPWRERRKSYRH